jgi:serine/threonine protein kinase
VKVTLFSCGPAANDSELLAFKHLQMRLESLPGDGEWIILTNLAFSVTHHLQSDEIDIVAIGPPGVRVIEVKHWTSQWADSHPDLVVHEAEKVTEKARKVGTTLRRSLPDLPRVDGCILLTPESSKLKRLSGREVRGVSFYSLSEWKAAMRAEEVGQLTAQQIRGLGRGLEPKSAVAVDGSLRRFAGYTNLELTTPKDERFHRVYKGVHSTRQDKVILHLYDLSVRDEANAEAKARREYEALQRLQLHPWAPRLLDSFQDAPGYPGEMFFFTLVDPAAPSIEDRRRDCSWSPIDRTAFARSAVAALQDLHNAGSGDPMVHRNLTTRTILVRHDNSPILTGFDRTKIPSDVTVASAQPPSGVQESAISPEVRTQGLSAADHRSDTYSLCACLSTLFAGTEDRVSHAARLALNTGLAEDPQARASLRSVDAGLSQILGESVPPPPPPPARFWTEDQVIRFRDRDYQIISRLGSGGIGTTFKVVELDRSTKEELGTYVAKVGHHVETGQRVLHAYSLVRPHLGRHPGLSAIFEIAREWQDNSFTALMTWIEGAPLRDFIDVFPLLADDQQECSAEALAIRWLRVMCDALGVLHRNGLVHGDISPRNMIVSGTDLVLTDYDFVGKMGEPAFGPATVLYCSPAYQQQRPLAASDDIYALAASFFHVLFDREPFQYGGVYAKERGLNWEGLDCDSSPTVAAFLSRATSPDSAERFASVTDARAFLDVSIAARTPGGPPVLPLPTETETGQVTSIPPQESALSEQRVDWLLSVLKSYPGSPRWGNQETRGLDTRFAADTYVETRLEQTLYDDIIERKVRLVILCGNAGDGKTALLQHLAARLGFGQHRSSERILEGKMADGLLVRMNLDGSAAWQGRSADELLGGFLSPFQQGPPQEDIIHVLAINDGRLLEWIDNSPETPLSEQLYHAVQEESEASASYIRFINLNQRSLVGNLCIDQKRVDTEFLDRLVDQLYGGDRAASIWARCTSCRAQDHCDVFRATSLFGPPQIPYAAPKESRARARNRLYESLQAVHLRGETHVTVRELRAALVYILFGVHFCSDYHEGAIGDAVPYWDRAFSPISPDRQGEVLREIARFDPALEAHPQLDRYLLSAPSGDATKTAPHYEGMSIEAARRRAYFEWSPKQIEEVALKREALGLARGQNLKLFLDLAFDRYDENKELCARLCRGISRLEDLPLRALDRPGVVPLRITPRTPTETTFWVEKPLSAFRLQADVPKTSTIDRLHRQASLTYRYRNGDEEQLRLGAELFHLLLELSDGYQLGDVSTDDTFAHLSIFVQRLIREDERELLAWNPMRDDVLYKVATRMDQTESGLRQSMVLTPLSMGAPA